MVALDQHGFLKNEKEWTENVATCFANALGIALTPDHWTVIYAAQKFKKEFDRLPTLRLFVTYLKRDDNQNWNSAKLHALFGKPLMNSCKIAGLPKPPHCM